MVTAIADSFITVVGKLMAGLTPATTPPGGLFLAMAYNVGVGLIGVPDGRPRVLERVGVVRIVHPDHRHRRTLRVRRSEHARASTYLLGHRSGATWYTVPGTPFNLRAINTANLGLDVAVYGYGALGIQYPGSFVKTTPV